MQFENETPMPVVNITLENGENAECEVLCIFDMEDYPKKEYIALMPKTYDGSESEVILFEYVEKGEDCAEFLSIEDEEEFNKAVSTFYSWLEE